MKAQLKIVSVMVLAGIGLAGCVQASQDLSPGFGASVRQNTVAQIADPDAKYKRDVQPASTGPRTTLAQTKYNKGEVTAPPVANASTVGMNVMTAK